MTEMNYSETLLRAVLSYVQFQTAMTCAREMFGKSYFSLGVPEKIAVDQAVHGFVASNFQNSGPEGLPDKRQGAGFLDFGKPEPQQAPQQATQNSAAPNTRGIGKDQAGTS